MRVAAAVKLLLIEAMRNWVFASTELHKHNQTSKINTNNRQNKKSNKLNNGELPWLVKHRTIPIHPFASNRRKKRKYQLHK